MTTQSRTKHVDRWWSAAAASPAAGGREEQAVFGPRRTWLPGSSALVPVVRRLRRSVGRRMPRYDARRSGGVGVVGTYAAERHQLSRSHGARAVRARRRARSTGRTRQSTTGLGWFSRGCHIIGASERITIGGVLKKPKSTVAHAHESLGCSKSGHLAFRLF